MEEKCRRALQVACVCLLSLPLAVFGYKKTSLDTANGTTHPLRFWLDEYAFSAGETTILREEIGAVGPEVAVIAGETYNGFLAIKGYYAPEQWDVYWTGRQGCLQALAHAVPGHKISCVPGLHELTMKDRLVARLTQFYGEGAFSIIPRSYLLPTQYWSWRLWLANQDADSRGEMWVLKKEVHRGKGVNVLPLRTAIQEAKKRELSFNYDVAQAYVENQFTVLGRKFYVRLWAVVTSSFPLRAYLFDGGVVVFGNTTPDDKKLMTSDDFIVNLWHLGRNTEAAPWSIAEFRTYLDNWSGSKQTFDKLWLDMRKALGLTFAAGVQSMRFSAASFPVAAAGASFELVGIDFLVDENMKPWLLEVNAVPSLARKVINCDKQPGGCTSDGEAESVFDVEKEKLVRSLFQLLKATAGTNLDGKNSSVPRPPSLADYLIRWRSNATDLAAMKRINSSSHLSIHKDLGWTPVDVKEASKAASDKEAEDLKNAGRELRMKEGEPGLPGNDEMPDSSTLQTSQGSIRPPSGEATEAPTLGMPGSPSLSLEQITRRKSIAEVTNLDKYVLEEERIIPRALRHPDDEAHEQILEEHLMEASQKEVDVAMAHQFLPLMMIPEAAEFSAEQQTSAYGGLAGILEKLRVGMVLSMPEINNDVTMGIAGAIPGADWLLLRGYQTFGWGDRDGTVEAMSVLPKHKLDQQLSNYVKLKENGV